MKYKLLILFICFVGFISACSPKGEPMEFSKACNIENEKKYLEVKGFLDVGKSVTCSNYGGRMDCGFSLKENSADAGQNFTAYIEAGSGANTTDEIKSSYKSEDIKIRDDHKTLVTLGEKVKLTGQMSITPDGSVCFMKVTKIER